MAGQNLIYYFGYAADDFDFKKTLRNFAYFAVKNSKEPHEQRN